MLELIILSSIPLILVGLFVANMITYKTDEEIIIAYFKKEEQTILQIKDSTESKFQNKERLEEINAKNKILNSVVINYGGPLLRYSFYSVSTEEKGEIGVLVTNSVMFFVAPKLYLDLVCTSQGASPKLCL